VTDDSAADYAIGSLWHYNGSVWVCRNNAAGAAVWVRMGAIESSTLDVSIADGVATVDLPYLVDYFVVSFTQTESTLTRLTDQIPGTFVINNTGAWSFELVRTGLPLSGELYRSFGSLYENTTGYYFSCSQPFVEI
jgi:hypothetical protein